MSVFLPTEIDFLFSTAAQQAFDRLQEKDLSSSYTMPLLMELRRSFHAQQAAMLLTLARLRLRAVGKFPQAAQMWFTEESVEQATHSIVAEHRASILNQQAPTGVVLDLGCGIGGDTLALAHYRQIIAYESDPVRLRFAQANAQVCGVASQIEFRCADWVVHLQQGCLPTASVAFVDPARRKAGKRIFHLHETEPPIQTLLALQKEIPALVVKTMPGILDDEIPPGAGVEFISHEGVCKEAVLWFGPLAQHQRWASVYSPQGWQQLLTDESSPPLGALQVGQTLHEPDPAIIRAHAFGSLCQQLDAHLFDSQIAYLVSDRADRSDFVQSFLIHEIHPFAIKRLNQRLRELGIGQVELKKRGFPVEPESLRPQLKLTPGGQAATIIFTRRGDERLMLIGSRIS